ncbi:MAG: hypothetical protein M1828_001167 [Chrysothrix sp. TS-e1954]|nr:MAG: hypothetical protein M1828_001167 [Chrysothrix sp. TS-e1954]
MRSFRLLGRCLLPVARPPLRQPWTCRHCRAVFSRFASSSALQTGNDEGQTSPVKRKRGRPRKDRTIESSVAQATPAPVAEALEPEPESTSTPSIPARNFEEDEESSLDSLVPAESTPIPEPIPLEELPSPLPSAALSSSKLSALHSRLALPRQLPLQTFARTLVDPTADPNPDFNNASLAVLGGDLIGYYMSEHLLCQFPRLPVAVLFAAQSSYVGHAGLANIAREWGVEVAAEPGGEVDPGLLQFKRAPPGFDIETLTPASDIYFNRRGDRVDWRRGQSSRITYDDAIGNTLETASHKDEEDDEKPQQPSVTTLDRASTGFIRAVFGAIYLHSGADATHAFFTDHILSRRLDLSTLFTFTQPTRDVSRLCAREGFDAPIARVLAETGRLSRHAVFVVGVFSGRDKLGEGSGNSLNEARFKAAVNALKGWYLYSPPKGSVSLPSKAAAGGPEKNKDWKPAHVDAGEVVA